MFFPCVGERFAVAHELFRRGHAYARLFAHLGGEFLVDQAGEDGRDEALEPDPLAIDVVLVFVQDFPHRIELSLDKTPVAFGQVTRKRLLAHALGIEGDRFVDEARAVDVLVADRWIVDERLVVRDDASACAQQLGQARRHIDIFGVARCDNGRQEERAADKSSANSVSRRG